MNRNFLTAFCIVALVGLSCPIVAKMACPVDEYFNHELQLVTESHGFYDGYDDFYFVYEPSDIFVNSDITNSHGIPILTSVYFSVYNANIEFKLQYCENNWGIWRDWSGISNSTGCTWNFSLPSGSAINKLYRISAHYGDRYIYSKPFRVYYNQEIYNSDSKSSESEVKEDYEEKNDEPKRKEEDIEVSETELSEVPEITE